MNQDGDNKKEHKSQGKLDIPRKAVNLNRRSSNLSNNSQNS
jgi:hypothetical protein